MAKELSTEELLKLPDDEILKYIRKMRPAELLRKRSKNIPTPREYKAGGGKVKNRNMGGVIGGGLNSQDVVDYLYKYKS